MLYNAVAINISNPQSQLNHTAHFDDLKQKNWWFEIGDLVGDFTKKFVTRIDGTPYQRFIVCLLFVHVFVWMWIQKHICNVMDTMTITFQSQYYSTTHSLRLSWCPHASVLWCSWYIWYDHGDVFSCKMRLLMSTFFFRFVVWKILGLP